jgi:hypothetical protein
MTGKVLGHLDSLRNGPGDEFIQGWRNALEILHHPRRNIEPMQ